MALSYIAQGVVALDIGNRFACQVQSLRCCDRGCRRGLAVRQPVQNVDYMGLGGNTCLKRQLHGAQHRLLVMLEHEGQYLDHLPITTGALEQLALQLPEGFRQISAGCAQ